MARRIGPGGVKLGPVELDRAAGALVGMAAGDALGAGYEFWARAVPEPRMIGGGLGDWEPGEWTDDTQMAICIAKVTAAGAVDLGAIGEEFVAWYRSEPADVGAQTASVLGGVRRGEDLPAAAAAYFSHHPGDSAGNGSLMRTAPVALAHLGDDAAIARSAAAVSALTHGDPLAGEACVLWSIAIDRAVRLGRLDGVRDGLRLLPAGRRAFWAEKLDEAERKPPQSFNPNGFVVSALQAAHAAVRQTPIPHGLPCRHLQRALVAAVSVGHDTDTVAAIAGALLGARWGASAVPLAWRGMLHGWPGLDAAGLMHLAVLTARRGRDDPDGWPPGPCLLPGSDGESHQGLVAALDHDPGVHVGDAGGLRRLPEGTDVVVSLCRVGPGDLPAGIEHHPVWLIDTEDPNANPNLDFLLADLALQIAAWRDEGRGVLVHDVRAESRTPTVAAAYLAHRLGISGRRALAGVRGALPQANPNRTFTEALDRLWPGSSGGG